MIPIPCNCGLLHWSSGIDAADFGKPSQVSKLKRCPLLHDPMYSAPSKTSNLAGVSGDMTTINKHCVHLGNTYCMLLNEER